MSAGLSIIVPTLGRATLFQTLDSISSQLRRADEVIVVADALGDRSFASVMFSKFEDSRWTYLECDGDGGGPGYAQRALGIENASGTHLVFMDDDDVYADGALALLRNAACDRPVIFRMDHPLLGVLWKTPELCYGNVGTPMFVVPNEPEKLGSWSPHVAGKAGDFTFVAGCCERMGDPIWREEIVAVISPAERVGAG
jgi:glycosyltransferase involved in cell wall biosynthesis